MSDLRHSGQAFESAAASKGGDGKGAGLPDAIRPLVEFPAVLRANGFAVAPDQTMGFIEAVGLLGPRDMSDLHRAAVAMLAIAQDRRPEFDALFAAHFVGAALPSAVPGDDEEVTAHEATGTAGEEPERPDEREPGDEASAAERLGHRLLADRPEDALALLRRLGPSRLPRRRTRRFAPARHARALDPRRAMREAARRDGEVLTLPRRRRTTRQRRIVLLIDVSGSMAERTESALRLAHALARVSERLEVFTLGTRLTRITPAVRLQNPGRALDRAAALIADAS